MMLRYSQNLNVQSLTSKRCLVKSNECRILKGLINAYSVFLYLFHICIYVCIQIYIYIVYLSFCYFFLVFYFQIGFHDNKKVKRCVVQKRINEIVNRLNKTEKKEDIDYRSEREQRDMAVRRLQRKLEQERKALEMKEAEEREALRRQRHYEDVDWNAQRDSDDGNLSDDFM
uniref:Coiled-coil domain-containing protein 25 n=1 Tax=Angiostrongylus cantonensis TaxID=6313 RepID=A0A0K0DHX4_ANGCA